MVLGNGGQLAASLGVFLYLARVLSPRDFGAMGIAAAVVDLLTVFGRFGQVEGLLQKGADDQAIRSTSFWLLLLIGLGNLFAIAALAIPIAQVTGAVIVAPVLFMLAAVPLIGNLGQVNEAIIRSELRYKGIAIRNVVATVSAALAAVGLATAGFGIYALAAQKLVFTIVYTLSVCIARPWLPDRSFCRFEAKRLLSTGFDVTISNTLQMANGRIVDLNIGFFLGVAALGTTRVAWRLYDFLLQLIIAPLSSVSYGLFARVRDDPEAFRRTYVQYFELIALIAIPVFTGMSILSRDAIVFLTGPKWETSAEILALLSMTVLASCISLMFSPVMVATGNTRIVRRQAVLQTVANVILTGLAAQLSITAVLVAYMARMYAFACFNVLLMNRMLCVTPGGLLRRLAPILVSTLMLAIVGFAVRHLLTGWTELPRMIVVSTAGMISYCATVVIGDIIGLWRGYLASILEMTAALYRGRKSQRSVDAPEEGAA
jgi:O-antigen/teichoic acid export membrane protein